MNLCFRLTIAALLLTVSTYCTSLPHQPSGKCSTVVAACQHCICGAENARHTKFTAVHHCVHNILKFAADYTPGLKAPSNCASKAHCRSLVTATRKEIADVATYSVAAVPTGSVDTHTTVSPSQVQLAPISNQSADASAAIIASISLHGQGLVPFGQKQRQVLMTALSATVTASTRMALTSMQVLSISEFVPNNTTSSPAPSRRLLVERPLAGKQKSGTRPSHAHALNPETSICKAMQCFDICSIPL